MKPASRAACGGFESRPYIARTYMEDVMKLKEKQLNLLRHLARFEILDYLSCLRILDTEKTNDRKALSYDFRPLTKHKYARKHKDDNIVILAKGRALFPDLEPLVTLGGGAAGRERVNTVSRVAMFLGEQGVGSFKHPDRTESWCFIPSACWRNIREGILSTTRFAGILFIGPHRLAVYDIGGGEMEWQTRAERSLFYRNHGDYETRTTGMLFICNDGKREEVAQRIIRTTMWQRRQLIDKDGGYERDRPVKYVRAPIRLAAQYERVYLTTPALLGESLAAIAAEEDYISRCRMNNPRCPEPANGDYEAWPYRYFVNIAADLLKYVYFFAAAKSLILFRKEHAGELNYAVVLPRRDFPILRMYPDVLNMKGLKVYEYRPVENTQNAGKEADT